MTTAQKNYIKTAKQWLVTQELSIKSCEINIEYYKKQIVHLQKSIVAEQKERKVKIDMKAEVVSNLKRIESCNSKNITK